MDDEQLLPLSDLNRDRLALARVSDESLLRTRRDHVRRVSPPGWLSDDALNGDVQQGWMARALARRSPGGPRPLAWRELSSGPGWKRWLLGVLGVGLLLLLLGRACQAGAAEAEEKPAQGAPAWALTKEEEGALEKLTAAEDLCNKGQYTQALPLAAEALQVLSKRGEHPLHGLALLMHGRAVYYLAGPKEALPELETAARLLNQEGLEGYLAQALFFEGLSRQWLGDLGLASARLSQALALYQKIGDPLGEANTRKSQGDVLFWQGRLSEASDAYARARMLFQQIADPLGEANTRRSQGDVLRLQGRLPEALDAYARALDLFQKSGNSKGEANTRLSQGDVLFRQSRLAEASDAYSRALELYQKIGDPLGEANTSSGQGDVLFGQGRLSEASDAFARALDLFQRIGDPLGEATTRRSQGDVLFGQGRLPEASDAYARALELYQKSGDPLGEANTRKSQGDVLLQQGRLPEASDAFALALALYQKIGNSLGEANTRSSQGDVLLQQGRLPDASDAFARALELYQKIGDPTGVANTYLGLARVGMLQSYRSTSPHLDRAKAWTQAREAFRGLSESVQGYGTGPQQRSTVEQYASMGAELLSMGALMVQEEARSGDPNALTHALELYDSAQALRGKSLLWYRTIAARLAPLLSHQPQTRDALQAFQDGSESLAHTLALHAARPDGPELPSDSILNPSLHALQQAAALPDSAFAPPTAQEVLETLRSAKDQPVLVEYYDSDEVLLAFVFDPTAPLPLRVFRLAAADTLQFRAEFWQASSDKEQQALDAQLEQRRRTLAEVGEAIGRLENSVLGADDLSPAKASAALDGFDLGAAHLLYQRLLEPLTEALGCRGTVPSPPCSRPLWIVPDKRLHQVPFAALPQTRLPPPPETDPGLQVRWMITHAPYLGLQRPLVTLPSAALLIPRLRVPRLAGSTRFFLGSPKGSGFCGLDRPELSAAQAQARLEHGPAPELVFTDELARELELQQRLRQLALLYISSHGMAPPAGMDRSALGYLLLAEATIERLRSGSDSSSWAPPEALECTSARTSAAPFGPVAVKSGGKSVRLVKPGSDEPRQDGLLFGEELLLNTWSLETAILSICVGARGTAFQTEGFSSLNQALLANGVETVFASLWPLRLETTPRLVQALTQTRDTGQHSWAQALLEARRSMLEGSVSLGAAGRPYPTAHPYFWAGFTLFGAGFDRPVLPLPPGW